MGEPQLKSNLVHFSLRIRLLVATILMISLRVLPIFFCGPTTRGLRSSGAPVRFIEPPEPSVPTPLPLLLNTLLGASVLTREVDNSTAGPCVEKKRRVTETDDVEGCGDWSGCSPPSRLGGGGLEKRREHPSRVWGGAATANAFSELCECERQ